MTGSVTVGSRKKEFNLSPGSKSGLAPHLSMSLTSGPRGIPTNTSLGMLSLSNTPTQRYLCIHDGSRMDYNAEKTGPGQTRGGTDGATDDERSQA